MDNKYPTPSPDKVGSTEFFTERELDILKDIEEAGLRPVSPSLAAQFFELFMEGYSCSLIAKHNPPFREGDVLFLRKKYKWDEVRDKYAFDLQVQMREKLMKQKLESLEFLTNMLSVTHKEHREKMLKYIQTGKEEDKPDSWISNPSSYKSILETIQKLTGEDRVTTQNIKSETKLTVESSQPVNIITPELQTKILKRLSEAPDKEDDKEEK